MKIKALLGASLMTIAAIAIAHPATAQPIPPASVNACTQRVAESMVVATRDIELTGGGPVDALKGTQTLFFRNRVTGQTAECRVNHVSAYVLSVTVSPQPRPPQPIPPIAPIPPTAPIPPIAPIPPSPPVPAESVNACIQRTAEDMVVAARDIEFVSAGPLEGNTGIRTLSMRNRVTGQTARCRVNTINNQVISVTSSPGTPPQVLPPTASIPEASTRACLQRTAEEMVVATRDLDVTSTGSVNAENGVGTVFLRNRVTGQTADCRVNTRTNSVLSVTITSPRPPVTPVPPIAPVPPGSGRPVPPNDPTARRCQTFVSNKIRNSFAEVQSLNFLPETTRRYFVSNAVESIRGEGNFSQRTFMSHRFNYNCNVNSRNGQVTGATYTILR